MVAFNKLIIAGALAATVSALPMAAPLPEANANAIAQAEADANAILMAREFLEGPSADFEKRASTPAVITIITQTVTFFTTTAKNFITLDFTNQVSEAVQYLLQVNSFLTTLKTSLSNYTPGTGLAGLIQTLMIKSGLQTVLLAITTIMSSITTKIISDNVSNPQLLTEVNSLLGNITEISNLLKSKGLSSLSSYAATLITTLNTLISSLKS